VLGFQLLQADDIGILGSGPGKDAFIPC